MSFTRIPSGPFLAHSRTIVSRNLSAKLCRFDPYPSHAGYTRIQSFSSSC